MLALTWDDPSRSFLFCVAMDPTYHYLNRIPSTLSVQCFIDDNTIAGPYMTSLGVMKYILAMLVAVQLAFKSMRMPAGKPLAILVAPSCPVQLIRKAVC